MVISKSFFIYRHLLPHSNTFAEVFLQKRIIFQEIHEKDTNKYTFLIAKIKLCGRDDNGPF